MNDLQKLHLIARLTSGSISLKSLQTGFPSSLPHKSQSAFNMAALARCTTPFSGPNHRNWDSLVNFRQNAPKSFKISSSDLFSNKNFKQFTAVQTISVPFPIWIERWGWKFFNNILLLRTQSERHSKSFEVGSCNHNIANLKQKLLSWILIFKATFDRSFLTLLHHTG